MSTHVPGVCVWEGTPGVGDVPLYVHMADPGVHGSLCDK